EVVGPFRLVAGLARRRLGHRRVCRGGADLAADRASGRRQAEVRLQRPAARHDAIAGRPVVEEPLAGGTRLPADEGGIVPGSCRGPVLAGLPSPRLPGDAGVRLPGVGTTASET